MGAGGGGGLYSGVQHNAGQGFKRFAKQLMFVSQVLSDVVQEELRAGHRAGEVGGGGEGGAGAGAGAGGVGTKVEHMARSILDLIRGVMRELFAAQHEWRGTNFLRDIGEIAWALRKDAEVSI